MIIRIDASDRPSRISLDASNDFQGFAVEVNGADRATREDLQRLGRPDGTDHVWVDQAVLIQLAGSAATDEWREQLEAMVAYAAPRGWVDESGHIRAHVSR